MLKSVLKPLLRPLRMAGGRFFIRPDNLQDSVIWKAAQLTITELIEGDYLEFGVFRGASFIKAFHVFRDSCEAWSRDETHPAHFKDTCHQIWEGMRFFAFDSFEGLPGLVGPDRQTNDFHKGQYACTLPAFLRNLQAARVDLKKVITIPGWFEKTCVEGTIKKYHMKSASIVYIDCDLGESARAILKLIEPLMVDGTVLIFDDWYAFRGSPYFGVRHAFTEWTQRKQDWVFTQFQKQGPWQNSFIANRTTPGQTGKLSTEYHE